MLFILQGPLYNPFHYIGSVNIVKIAFGKSPWKSITNIALYLFIHMWKQNGHQCWAPQKGRCQNKKNC
jgi:hypothetical protein